jgi:hypothetical protein
LEKIFESDVDHSAEIIYTAERIDDSSPSTIYAPVYQNGMSQTPLRPIFSVDNFLNDDTGMHFYTGLKLYAMFVLRTLDPAAYCLKYIYFQVDSVSVENQLFMTLVKLRRYTTNFELARFSPVCESTVKNIVHTWIIFMSKQWREVNIWPSKDLVKYFSPSYFKAKFPTTRVI